jgi:hypothetical protein
MINENIKSEHKIVSNTSDVASRNSTAAVGAVWKLGILKH